MRSAIRSIIARQIWDSRGRPTIEVDVSLVCGAFGRASAPAGASRGTHEAVELRDGGEHFGGLGVSVAVDQVNSLVSERLCGIDGADLQQVDQALRDLDGTTNFSHLGGNSTVAISAATAHAAAAAAGVPLWSWIAGGRRVRLPNPQVQIFGGGVHAAGGLNLQDFMILCPGADNMRRALEMAADVNRTAGQLMMEAGRLRGLADLGGWWPAHDSNEQAMETLVIAIERARYSPGKDVCIALDFAANELRRRGVNGEYYLDRDGSAVTSEEMIERVALWVRRYPIVSVEDPLGEDELQGMRALRTRLDNTIQVVADDLTATDPGRVRNAVSTGACNGVIIKVSQAGTLSVARAALEEANAHGATAIVAARSGDTEDVTVAHLAVGWNASQVKIGGFSRSERMSKWNELLRIEEELGSEAELTHYPFRVGR